MRSDPGFGTGKNRRRTARQPKLAQSVNAQEASLPHYRHFYATAPEGVLIVDAASSTVVEANPSLLAMIGVSRDDIVGEKLGDTLFGEDGNHTALAPQLLGKSDGRGPRSVVLQSAAGRSLTAEVSTSAYDLDGHSFVRSLFREGSTAPVAATGSEEARAAASVSLLDSLPHGCQIIDTDWRYVYVNPEAARQVGATAETLLGRTMSDCYPGIEKTALYAAISEAMDDRARKHVESDYERADGSTRTYDHMIFPVPSGVFVLSVDLTERRRIEAATANLAAIVESSDQAIIGKTLEGIITSWNHGAERLYGYAAGEMVGKPISILIPPGREDELPSILARIRSGERIPPYETVRRRRDKTTVEVLLSVSPVVNRNGKVVSASAIALDISTRKQAEREARESNQRFEMIASTIEHAFWIADPEEGQLVYVSPAYERIYGRSRSGLYDHPETFLETVHPDDRERVMKDLAAQHEGLPFSHDFRVLRSDGTMRWVNNRGYPIPAANDRGFRYVGVAQDITDRKAAEERSEEQARLLDVASDLIVVGDTKNRIRYWNRSAERMFGLSRAEVLGRDVFEVVHPTASRETLDGILEAVNSKGEWSGELDYTTDDGKTYTVLTRLNLVRDEKGEPKAILAVSTDVTEARSIERQLLRSQRLESLGSLAGGIAHDLNNVLTPILMGSESLSLRDLDVDAKKTIQIIGSSAERGAAIVRQILGFARGVEGERVPVQLKHVLREVETIVTETFPKSVDFRMKLPHDLWLVVGDSTQIHQVIMNVCVNARDAMPEGGLLTLSAVNQRLDDSYAKMHIEARPIPYVVIEVTDTGRGMSSEVLEKIFDPFFTTKTSGKGTGLGLSTARSIVNSHGGFITAYSEHGRGTCFKVYLPATLDADSQQREPEEGIPMGSGELIVVADDEAPVREISREILESYGYRVITADDGTEALVTYLREREHVAVVMVDMMMPYLDGTGTIRALRKVNPNVRVIATSGLLPNEQVIAVRELGANAFLPKPFTATTLLQTLSAVLSAPPDDGDRANGGS